MKRIGLSVIIPVYNSENWILPTLQHLGVALEKSEFTSEIIIVDDGSTDMSAENARKAIIPKGITKKIISDKNKGRYLARKSGVEAARYDNILFVDSRVFVGKDSLMFLCGQLKNNPDQIWNGHVHNDKKGSMFTRFWDAIVCIAWRRYFRHPKTTQYGIKDFDYYPKGTGFFYAPKKRLVAAMQNFEKTTNDIKHSSDDTLLIRFMNKRQDIHLSPEFNCIYHGRTNFKSFMKHAYHRGEFFIDGFLRPGTRFFIPLILVLFMSMIGVICLFIWPAQILAAIGVCVVVFSIGLFLGALLFGIEIADAASLAILGAPFAVTYLCGLWRGVLRKI